MDERTIATRAERPTQLVVGASGALGRRVTRQLLG